MYNNYSIHYNTGLTDQSSSNHISLDIEYQASDAPTPSPLTYHDAINQKFKTHQRYILYYELLNILRDMIVPSLYFH